VGEQPVRTLEVGSRTQVRGDEVLALAVGGGELVLGPLDVGVDLEAVVAGHGPAEHRPGPEHRGQVTGDVGAALLPRLGAQQGSERGVQRYGPSRRRVVVS
jgi:hypothetical protein